MTSASADGGAAPAFDPASRGVPRWGGLNLTLLGIELRRVLRNRRTIIFAFLFPSMLFFVFAGSQEYADQRIGVGNVSAYIMVSMALYGAALTAASGGAAVAVERSLGWSRQLRLTPLSPVSYILVKTVLAVLLGAIAVAMVNVCGLVQGKPDMPASTWVGCALLTIACSLVFAALGVFVGYLVPGRTRCRSSGRGWRCCRSWATCSSRSPRAPRCGGSRRLHRCSGWPRSRAGR
ncbi:MAG: ABC transporter permease [Nocardioides sp.]